VDLAPEIVARLRAAIDELRRVEADVRWARDAGLHLTLAFLGSVEIGRLPAIEAAVRGAVAPRPPIDIEVRGLGAFPGLRRPRVLWAGVRGAGLDELAAGVAAALAPLGFAADERPFRAHVTIGRVRSPRRWRHLEPLVRATEDREFGRCKARGVVAYRSDLRPDGAVYTKLWTAEMGDRDGSSD
jgi:RNA 2',3'-cyclic 3'-phosphodiesterase